MITVTVTFMKTVTILMEHVCSTRKDSIDVCCDGTRRKVDSDMLKKVETLNYY